MTQLNRYAKLMIEVDVMAAGERFSVEPANEQIWIVDNRPNPNEFPAFGEMACAVESVELSYCGPLMIVSVVQGSFET